MKATAKLKANHLRFGWFGLCAAVFLTACDGGQNASQLVAAEQEIAKLRSNTCGPANATADGLLGEYFAAPRWTGQKLHTRLDTSIEFPHSFELPTSSATAAQQPRSVRWTGWIKPLISGRYRFHLDHSHAKVSVAMQAVVGTQASPSEGLELSAGRFYPVTIELPDLPAKHASIALEWTLPHGIRSLVPRAALFKPTESVETVSPTR